jgi:hypothetical protein
VVFLSFFFVVVCLFVVGERHRFFDLSLLVFALDACMYRIGFVCVRLLLRE